MRVRTFSFEIKKKLNPRFLKNFSVIIWDAHLNEYVLNRKVTVNSRLLFIITKSKFHFLSKSKIEGVRVIVEISLFVGVESRSRTEKETESELESNRKNT